MVWWNPVNPVNKGPEKWGGGVTVIEKDNPASGAQVKPTTKFRDQEILYNI